MAILKRNIKFPLIMKNGFNARTLEELKENFFIEDIVNYFLDGKLKVWLEHRFYKEEACKVNDVTESKDLSPKEIVESLIKIFGVEVSCEEIENSLIIFDRYKKIIELGEKLQHNQRIPNLDMVAFSQEEFESLILNHSANDTIYLYGDSFELKDIPSGIMIEGINKPVLKVNTKELNLYTLKLQFKNIIITSDTNLEIVGNKLLLIKNNVTGDFRIKDTFKNLKFKTELKNNPIAFYFGKVFKEVFSFNKYIAIAGAGGCFIQILDSDGNFVKNIYQCRYDRVPKHKDDLFQMVITKSDNELIYNIKTGMIDTSASKGGLFKLNMSNIDDVKNYGKDWILPKLLGVDKFYFFNDKLYVQQNDYLSSKNLKVVDINNFGILEEEHYFLSKGLYFSNGSTGNFKEEHIEVLLDGNKHIIDNNDKILNPKDYCYSPNNNAIYFRVNNSPYIYIYDLYKNKLLQKFKPYDSNVSAIYVNGEFLVTLSNFGELKFWDIYSLELVDCYFLNKENKDVCIEATIDATDDNLAIVFNDVLYVYTK